MVASTVKTTGFAEPVLDAAGWYPLPSTTAVVGGMEVNVIACGALATSKVCWAWTAAA